MNETAPESSRTSQPLILAEDLAKRYGNVRAVDGVSDVKLDLVWEPPWDQSMMSEAAKLQLGM